MPDSYIFLTSITEHLSYRSLPFFTIFPSHLPIEIDNWASKICSV